VRSRLGRERRLGDATALELVQRMLAVALAQRLERPAHVASVMPDRSANA
jgi:hypothetical protein